MIQVKKSYILELSETQAKELYEILRTARDIGNITPDYEICFVYGELKKIFDSGIRSTESFESAKDYNHLYAPGTK